MFLDFLVSPAYAQAAAGVGSAVGAARSPDLLSAFWPLAIMIPLFYFMLIRPQMKRQREQRDMLGGLAKGDEVVVVGGLAGRVSAIGEAYLSLEIADGVIVKVQKSAVASVLPKGSLKAL